MKINDVIRPIVSISHRIVERIVYTIYGVNTYGTVAMNTTRMYSQLGGFIAQTVSLS